MKKTLLLLLILANNNFSVAQTKEEKADLLFVKSLFKKMKQFKINTKDTLLWKYTYSDTSISNLQGLSVTLEKLGLVVVEIKTSAYDKKKRELTVSEANKYNVETLKYRWKMLNENAKEHHLVNYQSRISGETRRGEIATIIYRPVQ